MKFLTKLLTCFFIIFSFLSFSQISFADDWIIKDLNETIDYWEKIDTWNNKNLSEATITAWIKIIDWFRIVFSAILVLFIVYSGIQMVLSMWTDDDSLSKSKKSLWYAIIWMIFVNFPIIIYNSIYWWDNLFLNVEWFKVLFQNLLTALQILIGWIAVFILVYEWIKVITKHKDDALKNAKSKIRWVITGLIFLWFIEVWKIFLRSWEITQASWIFKSLANLVLYISWPVAIFFICLAWYYYIFSNWDEDKTKKWKSIIINTSLWVILILCIYILLHDISLLNF